MQQNLLLKTSMNSVTSIVVPDLFYNQRKIKAVVEKYVDEIHPITTYIDITYLTNKSVTWVPRVDIDNFQSVKKKRRRHQNLKTAKTNFDENHSRNLSISSSTSPHPTLPRMSTKIEIDKAASPGTKSLTTSKLADIAKIEETTQKGRLLLANTVASRTTAIIDLQKDYDTILFNWDKRRESWIKKRGRSLNSAMK